MPTDFSNLDVTPFLFTAWEFATGDDARLSYLFHGTSTSNLEDPPLAEYARSDDYFATTATQTYAWCDSWSGTTCTQHFDIATHVPLVSAWDPASETSVFVRVQTSRGSGDEAEIKVHPGFFGSYRWLLNDGETVSDNVSTWPSAHSNPDWDWLGETEVAPGVACADDKFATYNCIIAWQERGVPEGRVLYTYFYVDDSVSPPDLKWHGEARIMPTSRTVSHVSAAFMADGSGSDDRFWVTWKEWHSDSEVRVASTDSSGSTYWSWFTSDGPSNGSEVVDPPTYQFEPWDYGSGAQERALIWTEVE